MTNEQTENESKTQTTCSVCGAPLAVLSIGDRKVGLCREVVDGDGCASRVVPLDDQAVKEIEYAGCPAANDVLCVHATDMSERMFTNVVYRIADREGLYRRVALGTGRRDGLATIRARISPGVLREFIRWEAGERALSAIPKSPNP